MIFTNELIKQNTICQNIQKNIKLDGILGIKQSNIKKELNLEYKQDNWWFCKKCNKKIMDDEYHKKYCNSNKNKHKFKLLKNFTKQFVKDKSCFKCGKKDHYILNCPYPYNL